MGKFAAIDLGTNTFHLLIIDTTEGNFDEIFREKMFVHLAEDGIERIGQRAIARALETLIRFRSILDQFDIQEFRAVGTAALRRASNGQSLIRQIWEETQIPVEIIDGEKEARLIYQGTQLAIDFGERYDLIMDIGGGSVEFIICNKKGKYWQKSFPIGVAILFSKFHKNDPITEKEIHDLEQHLSHILSPLIDEARQLEIGRLIGASGSFEVVEAMLNVKGNSGNYSSVEIEEFEDLHYRILHSNFDERLLMEGLPETRARLIVVALILMNFVCKKIGVTHIIVSPYALKEGMISEMAAKMV